MAILLVLVSSLLSGSVLAAGGLITQLATDHVDITTRFTGKDILVFGAMTSPGDIVIRVVSPDETVALSRKVPVGPFWLSGGQVTVRGAPGLMYVLSSRPLDKILPAKERRRYGLDFDGIVEKAGLVEKKAHMDDWRAAFVRLKRANGNYLQADDAVKEVGKRLFSATVALPAKIPLGMYRIGVYLVRDGKVIDSTAGQLDVQQVRMARWVAQAAHNHGWIFGISFTVFALVLGLLLGMALRRDSDA